MSDLDRPVWATLRQQPHWGLGDERARRFQPDINRFAATRDEGVDSLEALVELVRPGDDSVYLLQVPPIAAPPGLEAVKAAPGVQMVATRRLPDDDGVQVLGDTDAAEMLALATLTEPGPSSRERTRWVASSACTSMAGWPRWRENACALPAMSRSAVYAPTRTSAAAAWLGGCLPQ